MPNHVMREAQLEAVFRQRIRMLGGIALKLAPTVKGVPDRLVLLPGGGVWLIELKADDGRLSPAQVEWHKRVAELGTEVVTLTGADEIRTWVEEHTHREQPDGLRTRGPGRKRKRAS